MQKRRHHRRAVISTTLPSVRRRNLAGGLFVLTVPTFSSFFAEAFSSIVVPLESATRPSSLPSKHFFPTKALEIESTAAALLQEPMSATTTTTPTPTPAAEDTAAAAAAASSVASTAVAAASAAYPHVKLSWEQGVCELILNKYRERQQQQQEAVFSSGASSDKALPTSSQPLPPPLMCAVVGIPGSGKTTSAAVLAEMLGASVRAFATKERQESEASDQSPSSCSLGAALMMPFDGYHIPLSALRTMGPDAVYRRGAPDTFDASKLEQTLREIRYGARPTLSIPGFDHARGDPEEGAHAFDRSKHRIVVVEGLYLLHDEDGWESIRKYFDLSIYVDADLDVCMHRLKARNQCIPGYTPEEIHVRVDAVDRANALVVERSKSRADLVVRSAAY